MEYTLTGNTLPFAKVPTDGTAAGLSSASSCRVVVSEVASVKGDSTYVLSRGKEKVLFELAIKLKFEMTLADNGALNTILTGTLTVPEVCPVTPQAGETRDPPALA